jgi:hypothetical protein
MSHEVYASIHSHSVVTMLTSNEARCYALLRFGMHVDFSRVLYPTPQSSMSCNHLGHGKVLICNATSGNGYVTLNCSNARLDSL